LTIPLWDIKNNCIRRPYIDELSEAIYTLIQLLSVGEITSYGDLAKLLDISPRLVGRILGKNKDLVIIPCHRVVMKNLKLGGYSIGIEFKKKLLRLEGSLDEEDRVKRENYRILYDFLMDP